MKRAIALIAVLSSLVFGFSSALAAPLEEYVLAEGDRVEKQFIISNTGESTIEYSLWKSINADGGLCSAVKMRVLLQGSTVYGGSFTPFPNMPDGYSHEDFVLLPGEEHNFTVIWGLPMELSSYYSTKTCEFEMGYEFESGGPILDIPQINGIGEVTVDLKFTADYWSNPGDVVINEIAWAGSTTDSNDEWIELRNTRNFPITLNGWTIEGAGQTTESIVLAGSIPAHGYYLLSNFASTNIKGSISDSITPDKVATAVSLANGGEQLVLHDSIGAVVDQTPVIVSGWPAGEFDGHVPFYRSMARKLVHGDGLDESNWYTCAVSNCATTNHWDVPGVNFGTPKGRNPD